MSPEEFFVRWHECLNGKFMSSISHLVPQQYFILYLHVWIQIHNTGLPHIYIFFIIHFDIVLTSKSRTALGKSPSLSFVLPSSKGLGWDRTGFSS